MLGLHILWSYRPELVDNPRLHVSDLAKIPYRLGKRLATNDVVVFELQKP